MEQIKYNISKKIINFDENDLIYALKIKNSKIIINLMHNYSIFLNEFNYNNLNNIDKQLYKIIKLIVSINKFYKDSSHNRISLNYNFYIYNLKLISNIKNLNLLSLKRTISPIIGEAINNHNYELLKSLLEIGVNPNNILNFEIIYYHNNKLNNTIYKGTCLDLYNIIEKRDNLNNNILQSIKNIIINYGGINSINNIKNNTIVNYIKINY